MLKRNPRRGSALVEAAFVLPVFVLLACGSADLARSLYLGQVTACAARAGAHRALRCDPHAIDFNAIQQAAMADAGAAGRFTAKARVCACTALDAPSSCDHVRCSASPAAYVSVETFAEWKPLLRYPTLPLSGVIRSQAIVRVE